MAKVIDAIGSDDQTSSTIDLELTGSKKLQKQIKQDVGEFLVSEILLSVNKSQSPVAGERWPALKDGPYKKHKIAEGGTGKADMQLSGDMLDALGFKVTDEGIELGVFGSEAAKADGHNQLSGRDSTAPQRRFLPDKGQRFKADIQEGIEQIISDAMVESNLPDAADLEGVETRADLYRVFKDQFEGMTRDEITAAVLRNTDLVELLDELDLLDLLDV